MMEDEELEENEEAKRADEPLSSPVAVATVQTWKVIRQSRELKNGPSVFERYSAAWNVKKKRVAATVPLTVLLTGGPPSDTVPVLHSTSTVPWGGLEVPSVPGYSTPTVRVFTVPLGVRLQVPTVGPSVPRPPTVPMDGSRMPTVPPGGPLVSTVPRIRHALPTVPRYGPWRTIEPLAAGLPLSSVAFQPSSTGEPPRPTVPPGAAPFLPTVPSPPRPTVPPGATPFLPTVPSPAGFPDDSVIYPTAALPQHATEHGGLLLPALSLSGVRYRPAARLAGTVPSLTVLVPVRGGGEHEEREVEQEPKEEEAEERAVPEPPAPLSAEQLVLRAAVVREMLRREERGVAEGITGRALHALIAPLVPAAQAAADSPTRRAFIAGALGRLLAEQQDGLWRLNRAQFEFAVDGKDVRVERITAPWERIARPGNEDTTREIKTEPEGEIKDHVIKLEVQEPLGVVIKDEPEEFEECEEGEEERSKIGESDFSWLSPASGEPRPSCKKRRAVKPKAGSERTKRAHLPARPFEPRDEEEESGGGEERGGEPAGKKKRYYRKDRLIQSWAWMREAREREAARREQGGEEEDEEESAVQKEVTGCTMRALASDRFPRWTFQRLERALMEWRQRTRRPPGYGSQIADWDETGALLATCLMRPLNRLWFDNCSNTTWSLNREHFSYAPQPDGTLKVTCTKKRVCKKKKEPDVVAEEGQEWTFNGGDAMETTDVKEDEKEEEEGQIEEKGEGYYDDAVEIDDGAGKKPHRSRYRVVLDAAKRAHAEGGQGERLGSADETAALCVVLRALARTNSPSWTFGRLLDELRAANPPAEPAWTCRIPVYGETTPSDDPKEKEGEKDTLLLASLLTRPLHRLWINDCDGRMTSWWLDRAHFRFFATATTDGGLGGGLRIECIKTRQRRFFRAKASLIARKGQEWRLGADSSEASAANEEEEETGRRRVIPRPTSRSPMPISSVDLGDKKIQRMVKEQVHLQYLTASAHILHDDDETQHVCGIVCAIDRVSSPNRLAILLEDGVACIVVAGKKRYEEVKWMDSCNVGNVVSCSALVGEVDGSPFFTFTVRRHALCVLSFRHFSFTAFEVTEHPVEGISRSVCGVLTVVRVAHGFFVCSGANSDEIILRDCGKVIGPSVQPGHLVHLAPVRYSREGVEKIPTVTTYPETLVDMRLSK